MATTTAKKPQDRKPKDEEFFTFTGADGKKHSLPNPTPHAEKVHGKLTGEDMEAIFTGDEKVEGKLAVLTVQEAVGGTPAHAALKALPMEDYLRVVGEWMQGEPGEASVGESSGSSD